MKTLYIIGNGFDIAHKLDTSYWDFRVYLARTYPEFLQEFEHMYNIEQFDPSSPRVSAGAYKQWEKAVRNELWSEFENKMGYPNISEMIDISTSVLDDMDLDSGLVGIEDTMDSYWADQYGYIKELELHVKEWIETVSTNKVVIFGWSAGAADLPYLCVIRDFVSKNTKWYAYYHDDTAYNSLNNAMSSEDIEKKYEVNYIPAVEFWDQI